MLRVSEWLPNPAGKDDAEWIEIFNTSLQGLSLDGWRIVTPKGKPVPLRGWIPGEGHAVLTRRDFKFSLRNSDGAVALYDPSGRLVDESSYRGLAPEGQSANRGKSGSFFAMPTPGAANAAFGEALLDERHPFDVPLKPSTFLPPLAMMLGAAAVLAAMTLFIFLKHERLSELFLGKY